MKKNIILSIALMAIYVFIGSCGQDQILGPLKSDEQEISKSEMTFESFIDRKDEIIIVSLDSLSAITQRIIQINPEINEDKLRANIFFELKKLKDDALSKSMISPPDDLTWEETILLIIKPSYFVPTALTRNDALKETNKKWPGMDNWQTKADGFRHAYWNILLCRRINTTWAKAFTNAHESETMDDLDKGMDLHNNEVGRYIFKQNKKKSESQLSKITKNWTYKKVRSISQIDNSANSKNLVYIK